MEIIIHGQKFTKAEVQKSLDALKSRLRIQRELILEAHHEQGARVAGEIAKGIEERIAELSALIGGQ